MQMHQDRKGDVLRVQSEVKIKRHLTMFYKLMFKTNEIKINDVALVLGIYSQITKHRLCGCDASGEHKLLTPCDIGLFTSSQQH